MGRSGYSEDCYGAEFVLWRGAVDRAMGGKRGQKALREMVLALDALPDKKLVSGSFTGVGGYCALGALAKHRDVDVSDLNPKRPESDPHYDDEVDRDEVGARFDIAGAMAAEVMFVNDDRWNETPEERWTRMRGWAQKNIVEVQSSP